MKNNIAKLLAAFAAFGMISSAYADDSACGSCLPEDCETCAPVDVHCHKTYVNPHELDNCKVRFCGVECETRKLTFGGLIQVDYDYARVDDRSTQTATSAPTEVRDPFESGHFQMRRVRLGVDADLGNCWYGRIDLDLRAKCDKQCVSELSSTQCKGVCGDTSGDAQNPPHNANPDACNQSLSNKFFTLNEAYIEKIYEGNSLKAGYKKVNFGAEENTHAGHLKAIERSVATNYFTGFMGRLPCRPTGTCGDSRLGMGNRHVGLFMDGEYHNFGYGMAVTNGFQGLGKSSHYSNEIGLYGNAYYASCVSSFAFTLGFNIGYQPEGNTNWQRTQGVLVAGSAPATPATHPVNATRSSILAWNPYINLNWHKLSLMAEILGARVENGNISVANGVSNNAKPLGYTVMPSYMWDDNWEIVGRYSHLDTDERGVRISNVLPDANDVRAIAPAPTTNIFDEVTAMYVGLNYYMKNKTVKFSVGYEHADFTGRWGNKSGIPTATPFGMFGGDKAKADVVRARAQLMF